MVTTISPSLIHTGTVNVIGIASLEQDPGGNSFPTVAKTLKEVFRILKQGGVYYINNTGAVRGKLVLSSDTSEHTEMAETVTEP